MEGPRDLVFAAALAGALAPGDPAAPRPGAPLRPRRRTRGGAGTTAPARRVAAALRGARPRRRPDEHHVGPRAQPAPRARPRAAAGQAGSAVHRRATELGLAHLAALRALAEAEPRRYRRARADPPRLQPRVLADEPLRDAIVDLTQVTVQRRMAERTTEAVLGAALAGVRGMAYPPEVQPRTSSPCRARSPPSSAASSPSRPAGASPASTPPTRCTARLGSGAGSRVLVRADRARAPRRRRCPTPASRRSPRASLPRYAALGAAGGRPRPAGDRRSQVPAPERAAGAPAGRAPLPPARARCRRTARPTPRGAAARPRRGRHRAGRRRPRRAPHRAPRKPPPAGQPAPPGAGRAPRPAAPQRGSATSAGGSCSRPRYRRGDPVGAPGAAPRDAPLRRD